MRRHKGLRAIISSVILLTFLNPYMVGDIKSLEEKQIFRLLAVEGIDPEEPSVSGQCFIRTLLGYKNWNNKTDEYVSYIHLLSGFSREKVLLECQSLWRGNSTKTNIENEIVNFLAASGPDEIVIFYYHGHGKNDTLCLDPQSNITAVELNDWFESVHEKAYLCVIIDACHSGSWINDGIGSAFAQGKMTVCSCMSNQLSRSVGSRAWFTGFERIRYENSSFLPLGLIGGIASAKDYNEDGFISLSEDFTFAKTSTEQYSYNRKVRCSMNPVCYNDLGFDPPLIVRKTASLIDLNMDGIVDTLDISIVALAFDSKLGDDNWNTVADLNNDEWINIIDISIIAKDYGKTT